MKKRRLVTRLTRVLVVLGVAGVCALVGVSKLQAKERHFLGPPTAWCLTGAVPASSRIPARSSTSFHGLGYASETRAIPGETCLPTEDQARRAIGLPPTVPYTLPAGMKARVPTGGHYNAHTCSVSFPANEPPPAGKPYFVRCDGGIVAMAGVR